MRPLAKEKHQPRPIALTMGDPSGIAPEITWSAWLRRKEFGLQPFFILSQAHLFEDLAKSEGSGSSVKIISSPDEAFKLFDKALPVLQLPGDLEATAGKPDPTNGPFIIQSISKAVELVLDGKASSLVTNPINKHVLYQAGFEFPGHTEYLAALAYKWDHISRHPVMMLASEQLKAVPLTIHVPLRAVPDLITKELIIETGHIISRDMKTFFGIDAPRLAFAGLNPHAGENGSMGTKEADVIVPALLELQKQGVNAMGPFPADTLFHERARSNYDVVIAMYHDQALIPLKTLAFDEGVNVTLGLPFIRTSPDHGTAYDIAGKGIANPQSLLEALKLAGKMSIEAEKQSLND